MKKIMEKLKPISEKLAQFFHVKSFALTFAALFATFLLATTVFGVFFAKPEPKPELTGKVLATVTLPQKAAIVEEKTPAAHPESSGEETGTPPQEQPILPEVTDYIDGLTEDTTYGPLPIVREADGLKVFEAYKTPFKVNEDTKGAITLVMTDFGLSESASETAINELPPYISFILSPYAENLQSKISAARHHAQEIWMQIPTESTGNFAKNDAGPISLLSGLNSKQNLIRLKTSLGQATGYAGVAFTGSPAFKEDSKEFQDVLAEINQRGLGIFSASPEDKLLPLLLGQKQAPFIKSAIIVDKQLTREDILDALSVLETSSLEKGYAVGVFSPGPLAIKTISEWQKTLKGKAIQLAPLTFSIHQKILDPNT